MRSRDEPFDHHRGKLPLMRRTKPLRLAVFLSLNYACFIVVNAFLFYLTTGQWMDFSPRGYVGDFGSSLGEMFVYPINLLTHKWMILVTGALLAVVIFVPVVVAVLYRLVYAMGFVAIVAVLGHAPVLALCLACGCFLAARTPLRSDMPFLAFLLGMLPQCVYLLVVSFSGYDMASLPFEHLLLRAPLLVAAVAAVVAAAIVLSLARAMRFRPGVVWPVVAVLAAVPMAVFYLQIGPSELEYSIIARPFTPDDTLLEEVRLEDWQSQNSAAGLKGDALRAKIGSDLDGLRKQYQAQFDDFLTRRSGSPQAPAVLWFQAQSASMQLDSGDFEEGMVRYSAAWPTEQSRQYWQRLADVYSAQPQSALARWRLAELDLRAGKFDQGRNQLLQARDKLVKILAGKTPLHVPRREYYTGALHSVRRMLWIVDRNRIGKDPVASKPFQLMLALCPADATYRSDLERLIDEYGQTPMMDNLLLELANVTPRIRTRIDILLTIAGDGSADAYLEACYELGQLTRKTQKAATQPATTDAHHMALLTSRQYFEAVLSGAPNPWIESMRGSGLLYRRYSDKTVDQVCAGLADAAAKAKFAVRDVTPPTTQAASKESSQLCRVLEVYRPPRTTTAPRKPTAASFLLPCRIAVYQSDDNVSVALLRPTALLGRSDRGRIRQQAKSVEQAMTRIIDSACK